MSNVFRKIGGLRPGRSAFDLSYDKKFTADMGQLIPVMCDEVIPGDIFDISAQAVVRFQPLVAPILHEINLFAHYFFVPYRLLWEGWELFITGGPLDCKLKGLSRPLSSNFFIASSPYNFLSIY